MKYKRNLDIIDINFICSTSVHFLKCIIHANLSSIMFHVVQNKLRAVTASQLRDESTQ